MILRLACIGLLMLFASASKAAPAVTNDTISWPDDGWYQVQQVTDMGIVEVCQGGRSCVVSPGEYIVINLSSGERFEGIFVIGDPGTDGVSVTGNVISWPDNGWYQVLNESTYSEVCGGTRSCTVAPGSYLVINHTTGERFAGITVDDDDNPSSPIVVTDNTISWPDDGWYQVQSAVTYQSLCEGGTSCTVPDGAYSVINHTTGLRWDDVLVGESDTPLPAAILSRVGGAAAYYEAELLTLTLPVVIHEAEFVDNLPYQSQSRTRDIVISSEGSGTYSKTFDEYIAPESPFHRSSTGARSLQGDTVAWSGTQLLRSSSVFYNAYVQEVFETSNTIFAQELAQQASGTITGKTAAYEDKGNITTYSYDIVLDLSSMDAENTCAVLRGYFSLTFEQQVGTVELTEQTVGRSSIDENWTWVDISDGEITTGESIELSQRFYCNFLID